MRKLLPNLLFRCSNAKSSQRLSQISETVYQLGKCSISISSQITNPKNLLNNFSNFYINSSFSQQSNRLILKDQNPNINNGRPQQKIFRVIIQQSLMKKETNFNIDALRQCQIIDQMLTLHLRNKYAVKASKFVLVDSVHQHSDPNFMEILRNNMEEYESLLEKQFAVSVAYMICNKNVLSPQYLNLLKSKAKAINSNIMEKITPNSKICKSFQQFVFDNGYRLQHLFLRPYKNGRPVQRISQADNFNLKQLINVLNLVHFEGKIVLEDNQSFEQNLHQLEQIFRSNGFLKKKLGSEDGLLWYLFL